MTRVPAVVRLIRVFDLVIHHELLLADSTLAGLDELRCRLGVEPVVLMAPSIPAGKLLGDEELALEGVDVGCECGRIVLQQPAIASVKSLECNVS